MHLALLVCTTLPTKKYNTKDQFHYQFFGFSIWAIDSIQNSNSQPTILAL